jgi:hypothetical protein
MLTPGRDEIDHRAGLGLYNICGADGIPDQSPLALNDQREAVVNRTQGVQEPDGRRVRLADPPDSVFSLFFLCACPVSFNKEQVPRPVEGDPLFGRFGANEDWNFACLKRVDGPLTCGSRSSPFHSHESYSLAAQKDLNPPYHLSVFAEQDDRLSQANSPSCPIRRCVNLGLSKDAPKVAYLDQRLRRQSSMSRGFCFPGT